MLIFFYLFFIKLVIIILDVLYTNDMKAVDQVGFDIKCPIPMEITDFYQNNVILFNSRLYGATEFLQYKNEFTINGRFPCPHSRTSYPTTVQGEFLDNSDKADFTLLRQAFLDRKELCTNTDHDTIHGV